MKILIVEDDKISGKVMSKLLSHYGTCDLAVDGEKAINMFTEALNSGLPYRLVTLDIMMPRKDGHATLNAIREIEKEHGLMGSDGARIIMTTTLSDKKNIMKAFRDQCEAYLTKPIVKEKLDAELKKIGITRG